MKKLLLVLLVIVLTVPAFSQTKLGIGIEGGLNISNWSVSGSTGSFDSRTGLIMGGFLDISLHKNFTVAPGVRFVMKGASFPITGGTETDKMNYIEIPVILKACFPLTEVKPYIAAGPVIGFNMSATYDAVGGGQSQSGDFSANVSSTDFSLLFGGGVEFKIASKTSLFANFGYQLGLSNWIKNNPTVTAKNNCIQLTAGAIFGL